MEGAENGGRGEDCWNGGIRGRHWAMGCWGGGIGGSKAIGVGVRTAEGKEGIGGGSAEGSDH